ncbi:MAG: DUF2851 family protein, partial [Chloroflexota bacterium]
MAVSERFVAWVWRQRRVVGPLICLDGRTVQVVFPGRPWGEGQPDFQGALIAWPDGRLEHGDVEIHLSPRHWPRHGHQRDPAYGGVRLHVVLSADGAGPTLNAFGETVPTLVLEPYLARPIEELLLEFEADQPSLASVCQSDPLSLVSMLERAGVERFRDKAARLEGDLTALPPAELLWRGAARALGYTRNADAMTRLVEHVTLAQVRRLIETSQSADPALTVYGALLGAAQLLPSQRGVEAHGLLAMELEQAWDRAGWSSAPGGSHWETGRVRPGNHPIRRLAALALLALVLSNGEPLGDLAEVVIGQARPARSLITYFAVQAPSREWAGIVDLDRAVDPPVFGLVGRDRAAEIVVNAVLPLLHALGQYWGQSLLAEASLAAYHAFPRAGSNGLARHMAEQLFGTEGYRLANTACRQQGLLHLFRTNCRVH